MIKNLNVQTWKRKHVLKNVNLDANFGETTAIMGQSGSGKTTLLRYIANLTSKNLIYERQKKTFRDFVYVAQEDHLDGFMIVQKYLNSYLGLNYGFGKITSFGEKDRVPSLTEIKNNMPLEVEARKNKEKSGDGSKIVKGEDDKPNDLETLLVILKKKGKDFFIGLKSKT